MQSYTLELSADKLCLALKYNHLATCASEEVMMHSRVIFMVHSFGEV